MICLVWGGFAKCMFLIFYFSIQISYSSGDDYHDDDYPRYAFLFYFLH